MHSSFPISKANRKDLARSQGIRLGTDLFSPRGARVLESFFEEGGIYRHVKLLQKVPKVGFSDPVMATGRSVVGLQLALLDPADHTLPCDIAVSCDITRRQWCNTIPHEIAFRISAAGARYVYHVFSF